MRELSGYAGDVVLHRNEHSAAGSVNRPVHKRLLERHYNTNKSPPKSQAIATTRPAQYREWEQGIEWDKNTFSLLHNEVGKLGVGVGEQMIWGRQGCFDY